MICDYCRCEACPRLTETNMDSLLVCLEATRADRDRLLLIAEAAGMHWPQTVTSLKLALESFPAGRVWLRGRERVEHEMDRLTKIVEKLCAPNP